MESYSQRIDLKASMVQRMGVAMLCIVLSLKLYYSTWKWLWLKITEPLYICARWYCGPSHKTLLWLSGTLRGVCSRILSDTNYVLTHGLCTATIAATVFLAALVLSPPHSYSTFEPSSWHGEPSALRTLRLAFCRRDSIVVIYFLEEAMKPCGWYSLSYISVDPYDQTVLQTLRCR